MAYTDLTSFFATRLLIEWESFDELAENDKDNLLASGTKALFVQASAPIGWTQDAVNAKALRVVSGSGGSTGGGSQDPGATISLAHTHTVDAHTHSLATHSHVLDATVVASFQIASSLRVGNYDAVGGNMYAISGSSGSDHTRSYKNRTKTDGSGNSSSNGSTTNSALSDVVLKYKNAIICTKD